MKAKMYIRGVKDPIELEKEEAEVIAELKSDATKDNSTPVNIEGVWTGTKGDIKFVLFSKEEQHGNTDPNDEPLSDAEVRSMQPLVDECIAEALAAGFISYQWQEFYLRKKGVLKLEIVEDFLRRPRLISTVINAEQYPIETKKIRQYLVWKGKKEYAEKMRLKHLEETASKL